MTRGRMLLWLSVGLLVAGLAGVLVSGLRLVGARNDNTRIAVLASGHDIPVAPDDDPAVVLARIYFLTYRDRLDEAQPLLNRLVAGEDRERARAALYDMANARLRLAIDHLGSNRIDPAVPLVRLAKDGYRRALVLDPGFWDAKYNLDIAMRLVRDFPQIESEGEEIPPDAAKKLWTDLPGLPQGLP